MEKEIAAVAKYFSFFQYSPNFDEIYRFFPKKIAKKRLKASYKAKKYTLPEYSLSTSRKKISEEKLSNWRFKLYIRLISSFSQIKLVGLSGSISMMNADLEDDIDLFVITARNRLFTARFLATMIAFIIGLKRPLGRNKAPNKICLNLFFEENNLKVPKFKQNLFVGHEVLQMRPIVNKNQIYEQFLAANKWVFKLFPNASIPVALNPAKDKVERNKIGDWLENLLKRFQLKLINKHKTTELITNTQLWFHPDDFEKKIPRARG